EQDGVQGRLRLDPGRGGLHRLGPADLRAVPGDHGVQRHVLRLERGHLDAAPGEPAADPRGDRALARLRRGARDQQPLHGIRPPAPATSSPFTASAPQCPRPPALSPRPPPSPRDQRPLPRGRPPAPATSGPSTAPAPQRPRPAARSCRPAAVPAANRPFMPPPAVPAANCPFMRLPYVMNVTTI